MQRVQRCKPTCTHTPNTRGVQHVQFSSQASRVAAPRPRPHPTCDCSRLPAQRRSTDHGQVTFAATPSRGAPAMSLRTTAASGEFESIGCRVVGSRKAGRASYGRRPRRLDLGYFGRRRKGDAANRFGPRERPVLAAGGLAHGCVLALTGKASDAIQILTSAITTWRATGLTCSKRANCWLRFTGGSLRA